MLLGGPAWAFERPALDDFYERTRDRAGAFDDCTGFCDGRRLLQLLVGGQVANPSTDRLRPTLAEGLRLGLDAGLLGGQSVARSAAFADLLWVPDTGDRITDLTWKTTAFYSTTRHGSGNGGVHLSADAVLAERTELQPSDVAELTRRPYRLADAEVEVAAVGPKVDKDAHLAFPVGAAWQRRWDLQGDDTADRATASGAVAFRGFPKRRGDHYQLDAARVSRVQWITEAGEATAWRLTAGYQRLSPDLPGVELWILTGYGWHEGANAPGGWLAQVGAELDVPGHNAGVALERWFALDRDTRRFVRTTRFDAFYRYGPDRWWAGARYGYVSLGGGAARDPAASLHLLEPELGWRPPWAFGLSAGLRYRAAFRQGASVAADEDRFTANVDWLF